jgi:hypothetical protein
VVSDLGLFTAYDGFVYTLIAGALLPELLPMLLVAIATVRDARGLDPEAASLALVLSGLLLIVRQLYLWRKGVAQFSMLSSPRVRVLALAAMAVVAYVWFVSLLYIWLDGPAQTRSPTMKARMMIFLIVIGLLASMAATGAERQRKGFAMAVWLCILHMLLVAFLKLHFGNDILASEFGRNRVFSEDQLFMSTELGFPRIIGTWISPNQFGMCGALLLLLGLVTDKRGGVAIPRDFLFIYIPVGFLLALLALSKGLTIYFILTAGMLILLSQG